MGAMTRHIVLSLTVAAVLLASSLMVALTPKVSAFDPGGPPVGEQLQQLQLETGNGSITSQQAVVTVPKVKSTKAMFNFLKQSGSSHFPTHQLLQEQ